MTRNQRRLLLQETKYWPAEAWFDLEMAESEPPAQRSVCRQADDITFVPGPPFNNSFTTQERQQIPLYLHANTSVVSYGYNLNGHRANVRLRT
jgi:hypothetical protein